MAQKQVDTRPAPVLPLAGVTAAVSAVSGYLIVSAAGATSPGRMLPWVLARGFGLAAYLGMVALTALGLWLRHPWRWRLRRPSPMTQMWVHASLAAVTGALLVGHVVAIVLDKWAGVGLRGTLVPGAATYRPTAVALGTIALYTGLLVGLSVPLAGRLFGRAWLPVHRLASAVFVLTWLHGVLAGSDSGRLRLMYVATGGFVAVLAWTRRVVQQPAPALPVPAP